MKNIIIILLAILPTLILWNYINGLDKHKEPPKVLRKLFLGGFLSIIITLVISLFLSLIFTDFFEYEVENSLRGFLYTILGIGLVEELSKFLMMYTFGWHENNLDETYDIILYSMIVALGFATAENIFYSLDGGFTTAIIRFFTAVPGHAIDGAFMGYFLYLYRLKPQNKVSLILAVLVPALTHGLYDFIAFTARTFFDVIIFGIYVIIEFVVAKKIVKESAVKSTSFPLPTIYCSNCGKQITTRFCPNCGKERE